MGWKVFRKKRVQITHESAKIIKYRIENKVDVDIYSPYYVYLQHQAIAAFPQSKWSEQLHYSYHNILHGA